MLKYFSVYKILKNRIQPSLLYVTTEVNADHSVLINRITQLDLQYLSSVGVF